METLKPFLLLEPYQKPSHTPPRCGTISRRNNSASLGWETPHEDKKLCDYIGMNDKTKETYQPENLRTESFLGKKRKEGMETVIVEVGLRCRL
ncbi:probable phosphoribosylformylglycinamidine synthase, chloroplastic/mitochondrial [Euphorbia lathyris]|uniref:probable phosphoribosylformylglycinamidine synthase, chloroplastic/mitochondrial n=1 Tax=Euphorbia lathyris TaxID=212925 RepID=UPI0033135FF6